MRNQNAGVSPGEIAHRRGFNYEFRAFRQGNTRSIFVSDDSLRHRCRRVGNLGDAGRFEILYIEP
jgi:hypothetical protein